MQPVQMNAQIQANVFSHVMQHLQMKADLLAQQQMAPEVLQQYQGLIQQSQMVSPVEANAINQQANDILPSFHINACWNQRNTIYYYPK